MAAFSDFLRNRIERNQRDRGAILVLTALVMLLLLFVAAFATDLGAWYRQGQAQQRAADVGSLNGIQAYNRGVSQYFESLGDRNGARVTFQNASDAEKLRAEEAGMAEAVNTVIGLLETSGLTFNNNPDPDILSTPTAAELPGGESVYQLVADDGTVVVIRRTSVTNPDGTMVNVISVELTAEGDQYFSNVLRDAPEITRAATSSLSNCGAECTRSIVINPPFTGFDAAGSGDGWAPLLRGDEEIWAVNHHVRLPDWPGDIVCMDRATQTSCGLFSLNDYHTPTHPVELWSASSDKIYAAATDVATDMAGLLCFDTARRQFCDNEFIGFWENDNTWSSPAQGVWEHGGNVWVMSHHGEIACVTTSANAGGGMQPCRPGDPDYDTAIVGNPNAETEDSGTNRSGWGTLIGDELFLITRGGANQGLFHCFNLDTRTPCWGGTVVNSGGALAEGIAQGFTRHSTTGAITGICVTDHRPVDAHHCVDLNGNNMTAIPNFNNTILPPLGEKWIGGTFSWEGKRTFFGGGFGDSVTCYDWTTQNACAENGGQIDVTPFGVNTGPGKGHVEPYGFAAVTPECLVGLGDESVFFSFSPTSLGGCVDTRISTEIFPCECADGGNRWGEIRLPAELIAKVNSVRGTVSETANGPAINSNVDDVDLLANGGVIDLAGVDPNIDVLHLLLIVETKLKTDGTPVFESPITADLQIVVQPTLIG